MLEMTNLASVRKYLRIFEHQAVRLAMGKGGSSTFHPGVSGAVTEAKLDTIRDNWLSFLVGDSIELADLPGRLGITVGAETVDEVLQPVGGLHPPLKKSKKNK